MYQKNTLFIIISFSNINIHSWNSEVCFYHNYWNWCHRSHHQSTLNVNSKAYSQYSMQCSTGVYYPHFWKCLLCFFLVAACSHILFYHYAFLFVVSSVFLVYINEAGPENSLSRSFLVPYTCLHNVNHSWNFCCHLSLDVKLHFQSWLVLWDSEIYFWLPINTATFYLDSSVYKCANS